MSALPSGYEWIKENLAQLLPQPPETIAGETLVDAGEAYEPDCKHRITAHRAKEI
jgi:hypothetical protein